jgi:hypothetical protein
MQAAQYFQWGWILITVPNLIVIVIGLMLLVFLAAVLVQLPGERDGK